MAIWPTLADAKNIFFLFEVENLGKAQDFISNPDAAKAGRAGGVLDGEYHFLADGPQL